jgi:hypothetical protein
MTETLLGMLFWALLLVMWAYFGVTSGLLVHEWWKDRRLRKRLK